MGKNTLSPTISVDLVIPSLENQTKRTIQQVLDCETGELLDSNVFFKQSEDILIKARRRQEEAADKQKPPKLVCAECQQTVRIIGKAVRGRVSYFAHLYDSEACSIKTKGEYTKHEIELLKYQDEKESDRHQELKSTLKTLLELKGSRKNGIDQVQIEKRITASSQLLNWRIPDVQALIGDKRVVFEIQLSTTFLSVIVARDFFYRYNNIYIIWLFNYSENDQHVNFESLMCKDVFYGNKRNLFLLNSESIKESIDQDELILQCIWFEPSYDNPNLEYIRHTKLVKFSELNYDQLEYKPYYIDADSLFSHSNKDIQHKVEFETSQWFIDAEKSLQQKADLKLAIQSSIRLDAEISSLSIKNAVDTGVFSVIPFLKSGLWGFQCNTITISKPKYNKVGNFNPLGFYIVKKSYKYGLVNKYGQEVVPCIYEELLLVFSNCCLALDKKGKVFINYETSKSISFPYDLMYSLPGSDNLFCVEMKIKSLEIVTSSRRRLIKTYTFKELFGVINLDGSEVLPPIYTKIYDYENGIALVVQNGLFGCIDRNGKEIIPTQYDKILAFENGIAKVSKGAYWGCMDIQGKEIIPVIYNEVQSFVDGLSRVKKDSFWGYYNEIGIAVIEPWYQQIDEFKNGIAIAKRNGLWGFLMSSGAELCSFEYEGVEPFDNGFALVKKNQLQGVVDLSGYETVPCTYNSVSEITDGILKVRQGSLFGLISTVNKQISSINYDKIFAFHNNRIWLSRSGLCGCIDYNESILVPFKYDYLQVIGPDLFRIALNGKEGYINFYGKMIIPPIYDVISDFKYEIQVIENDLLVPVRNLAKAAVKGNRFHIDIKGKIYQQSWSALYRY